MANADDFAKVKNLITVKQLIEALNKLNPDAEVYVGAQGYSNYNADTGDYWSDNIGVNIVKANNGGIIIRDNCMVEGEE